MSPTWHNHTGNQSCEPRAIESPGSLEALVELVRRAEREGTTVRAVGAGHAWSDAALTDGYLVLPDDLRGVVALEDGTLREGATGGPDTQVRVLGGTPLRELNAALDHDGLALRNMGGYDAQTIAGVVSTSTHGSGLSWGPFPDMVRSLDLVVAGGEVVRVEPSGGITDPAAFESVYGGERRLVQDDGTFAAAVCGMGCMGVVYSVVIEVREKFWLNEVRTIATWEETRASLTPDGVLGEGDHYELFLNPYPRKDGRHNMVVTRRGDCPDPGPDAPDRLERHPLTELEASLVPAFVFRFAARWLPRFVASQFEGILDGMRDPGYPNVSFRVFNIGSPNKLPAYSMELGVALEGDRHLEAVDRILSIAVEQRKKGRFHTSPIALRFVAPSGAYASMMYDRATMMIELIMLEDTRHGYELLAGYEERLADLDVRAHWGQYNTLTDERIRAVCPRWDSWLAAEKEFNSSGVFDAPFTRRVGISSG